MCPESNLPSPAEKPSLLDWLEEHFHLPFRLPRIPLVRTAANLDKAAGALITAGGDNLVARVEATTNRIRAKSSAEVAFIQFGQASIAETGGLAERALHYALGEAAITQKNREEILRIASEDLSNDPPKEDASQAVDDDWLDAFKRYAETKSNTDIQQLWARILSAEIRKPGSSSLRTLAFLSTISSDDANFIVRAFTYVVYGMFIPNWAKDTNKIPYHEHIRLHELGITTAVPDFGGAGFQPKSEIVTIDDVLINRILFRYYDYAYVYENKDAFQWQLPVCPLSQIGREIFELTNTKVPDYSAIDEFSLSVKPNNVSRVSKYKVTIADRSIIPAGPMEVLFANSDT
jgi:hypothetical protein